MYENSFYSPFAVVLLLFLAALICVALARYAWTRRELMPGTWAFALLMLAIAEWALGYALELRSSSLEIKLLWIHVRSLGMATGPVLWLIFALYYAGVERWLSRRRLAFLLSLPLPFLTLVFTNSWHHLVWKRAELISAGRLQTLSLDLGSGYWIAVAYAYLCILLGSALLLLRAARESHLYRRQVRVVVIAALLPLVSHIVSLVWAARVGGLNLAPFAFAISGLLIALNIYGFRFLRITPIAHRTIIANMRDGVIVLDVEGRVVSINPAAARILDRTADEVIGRPAEEALRSWPALEACLIREVESQEALPLTRGSDLRYYDLTVTPLQDGQGRPAGRILVLRDVTQRERARAALQRRDAILEAVAFAAQRLLQVGEWDEAMGEVLAHLGQAIGVSRVYVFENHTAPDGTLLTSQRYEWVAPGITPQIDNPELQNLPWLERGFERWVARLGRREAIAGLVREFPERERVVLELQDILSILVLPIFVGEEWWGFIGFDECQRERRWAPAEQEALRAAAGAIGVAIQRRRIEERLHRLATVATEVTGSLDLTRVLDAIASSALELVQATDVHIYLYDPEKETFTFGTAIWEDGRRTPAVPQVRPHGLTATVAHTGQRVVIEDATNHPLYTEPTARAWGVKSIAGFPLRRADRIVGVFTVAFLRQHHRFTEDELRVLGLLADQAAIAIENARLVEAEREARYRAETLQEVASVLNSVLEPQQLLDLVLEELEKLVPYDSASVMLVREGILRVVAARGFPEGTHPLQVAFPAAEDPFFQEVLGTRQPVILKDAHNDPRFRRLGGVEYVRGWICAPLLIQDQVIGLLTVDNRVPAAYDERHARVVQTFAHHVAIAVENARLHAEVRRQAITDGLTGLYNHRHFYELLEKELTRSRRYRRSCSLIMLDLDDFKSYNDRYGHLAGDDLLRELAGLIRRVIRQSDLAARYGGEEFALILPETNGGQALALAQRLVKTVRDHEFQVAKKPETGHLTISIGVATYPTHARDVEGLVHAADLALLQAKAEGKDRVCVAQEGCVEEPVISKQ